MYTAEQLAKWKSIPTNDVPKRTSTPKVGTSFEAKLKLVSRGFRWWLFADNAVVVECKMSNGTYETIKEY
jgi:hypothetical protein